MFDVHRSLASGLLFGVERASFPEQQLEIEPEAYQLDQVIGF